MGFRRTLLCEQQQLQQHASEEQQQQKQKHQIERQQQHQQQPKCKQAKQQQYRRGQKQQQQHQRQQPQNSTPTITKTPKVLSKTKTKTRTRTIATAKATATTTQHHKWRTWMWRKYFDNSEIPRLSPTAATTTTEPEATAKYLPKGLSALWLTLFFLANLLSCISPAPATPAAAAATAAAAVTSASGISGAFVAARSTTTHETPFEFRIDEVDEEEQEQEEDNDVELLSEGIVVVEAEGEGERQGEAQQEAEGETELVDVAEVNSNEEELLAYYKRAQQRKRQQQHRHHTRDLPPPYAPLEDFDALVPMSGVVSTLSPAEQHTKRGVTKRSATRSTTSQATPTAALPTATTTAATPSVGASNFTAAADQNASAEEKCEARVLDEIPTEPFYDFTDITEDAARQFTDFLAVKFSSTAPTDITAHMREEVRRRANGIASYALNEDDTLLAFAIAAPSIHTVVVKFRENVTIPPQEVHNKAFLGSYWRELGYAWNSTDGSQQWGAPFKDCNLLKGRWLWPFRISFVENKFKIVAATFIAADEDVCNDGLEDVFGRRHGCDRNTTFCLLTENKHPVTRDVYSCICRESYYLPNSTLQGFRGDIVEMSAGFDNFSCIPCPGGCSNCDQNGECLLGEPVETVSMQSLLNLSVGSMLGACILCCIVLSVIVFQQRKCKAIASGMWTVLETILLGIVLLYASVAVHFFSASTERCLLEPWLRELGFVTCYGAIILKLYRHLVDFRTRKAHRWVLRDVDLLKYLGTMVFAVACYMAAFTASALDLLQTAQLESLREASTNTCQPLKWEYVTQASEMLILCFGLHLSFASRNANTQFRERQFLVAALVLEFLMSGTFYLLRFFYLPEMTPSVIFLALFLRSQFTNTISLGLIFVPKLWYQHRQGPHDAGQRLGGGYAGLCLGDPDIGELTISEMSPEDIRAELKRLYTQLEILKNKTLRQDNPHISKRRGGRKVGHRRFSLQKKGSKDKALSAKHRSNKHHQDIEITEAEPSRTPEDSVCSVEGPTDTYAEISGISHSMLSHSMVSHSVVSHSK